MKKTNFHITLAQYFSSQFLFLDGEQQKKPNLRKCAELPYQQTRAAMWDEVTETLCDVFFMEARARAGLLDLQLADYTDALSIIPQPENSVCLDDFYRVFRQQKHIIGEFPELTFQQIYNELQWTNGKSKHFIENSRKAFLSQGKFFIHQYRVPGTSESRLIMTLAGHTAGITSCAFSPDGKLIVSLSRDNLLRLWDAGTGNEITTLARTIQNNSYLKNESNNLCRFISNGKKILALCDDKTLTIWDSENGKRLAMFIHADTITNEFALSGCGTKLCVADSSNNLYFHELQGF